MVTISSTQFPRETDQHGEFVRQPSQFRDWVTVDGSTPYQAEPGRYHLYVSYACPWASRTIIVRMLKGLQDVVSMSVVDPIRDERGWAFRDVDGAGLDPIHGFTYLREAYIATDPSFSGRITVPVLWDKVTQKIVSNESTDIVRMLNTAWDTWGESSLDLYPNALRAEIDTFNERIYQDVNNGVYRAGFATRQVAYETAVKKLFAGLDWLEAILAERRYLLGERITEADWRFFTTLIRFDAVYVGHFKCNVRRLVDYENLWGYTRDLYQQPGVAGTVNFDHIKKHYYVSHHKINPTGIVPLGPSIDFFEPHNRGS